MEIILLIHLEDIQPLTEFQRNTRSAIAKLKKNRRPAILTINGQAEIIVQDIKSYQQLLARVEEANKLLELRRSIAEYRAGRARPMDEALDDLEAANPSKTGRAR
jgi:hypothetical protein